VTDRALSTPVGAVALVAVTVALAVVVGSTVTGSIDGQSSTQTRFSLTVDPTADRIEIEHRGGGTIDVRELSMVVSVNGRSLDRQPPVPFFAARGFVSGPTGPFNSASDPTWTAGERGSIAIAETNAPTIDPGDKVRIRLLVNDRQVAVLETTADGTGSGT